MLKNIGKSRWRFILFVTLLTFCVPAVRAQNNAEATYKAKCAGCHGPDGSGNTPAGKAMGTHDFHSPDVQKASDSDLAEVITKGKNKMPAYGKQFKAPDIDGLVAYIRTLAKK